MTNHVRNTYITPKDLLHRESSLCDYCQTTIGQAELLLIVMRENYGTSFIPWSRWVALLASLKREMAGRSQLLCLTAHSATRGMHAQRMSYHRATMICSSLFEVKNESTTPLVHLEMRVPAQLGSVLHDTQRPLTPGATPGPSWPNGGNETQRRQALMQGY